MIRAFQPRWGQRGLEGGLGGRGRLFNVAFALSKTIEARFTGLGGTVRYGARVTKVLERNGRATGVRLEDGTEMEANYVMQRHGGHGRSAACGDRAPR